MATRVTQERTGAYIEISRASVTAPTETGFHTLFIHDEGDKGKYTWLAAWASLLIHIIGFMYHRLILISLVILY